MENEYGVLQPGAVATMLVMNDKFEVLNMIN
jgi:hypothetical protein